MMKVCVVAGLLLLVAVQLTRAMVCLPDTCKHVTKPVLNCKGGVLVGGGWCGCTDICTSGEGEPCSSQPMFGGVPQPCEVDLKCVDGNNNLAHFGVCKKLHPDVDLGYHPHGKRAEGGHQQTRCEQMRIHSLISMVVYQGQWIAKCDSLGNFMPMQCDNTRHCFCVDTLTGEVQEGTKVLGTANCS